MLRKATLNFEFLYIKKQITELYSDSVTEIF